MILPNAEVKIFLTAKPEARAKRRYNELLSKGQEVTYEQVYREMIERDKNDSTRAIAPCVPAKDAIMLDNSGMTERETLNRVIKIVKKAEKKLKKGKVYLGLRSIVAPFVRFFQKLEVIGADNIPREGGYLLCSNHIAKRDIVMLGIACPRPIKFIAKKELFSIPILSSLLKGFGAIALDRGGNDVAAMRASVELLKNGEVVSIFPQGHRYPKVNPAQTPLKNGAAMIAYRSKCAMIPVCIKTDGNKYKLFKKVQVIFGKPVEYEDLGFINGGNEEYARVTSAVFAKVVELGGFNSPDTNTEG